MNNHESMNMNCAVVLSSWSLQPVSRLTTPNELATGLASQILLFHVSIASCAQDREIYITLTSEKITLPCGTNATENSGTTLSNHYQRSDSLLFSPVLCLFVGVAKTGCNTNHIY